MAVPLQVLPRVLAGYVVMAHTPEAISDGMHRPLRLKDPEVGGGWTVGAIEDTACI